LTANHGTDSGRKLFKFTRPHWLMWALLVEAGPIACQDDRKSFSSICHNTSKISGETPPTGLFESSSTRAESIVNTLSRIQVYHEAPSNMSLSKSSVSDRSVRTKWKSALAIAIEWDSSDHRDMVDRDVDHHHDLATCRQSVFAVSSLQKERMLPPGISHQVQSWYLSLSFIEEWSNSRPCAVPSECSIYLHDFLTLITPNANRWLKFAFDFHIPCLLLVGSEVDLIWISFRISWYPKPRIYEPRCMDLLRYQHFFHHCHRSAFPHLW
jgi:hypothetical protein